MIPALDTINEGSTREMTKSGHKSTDIATISTLCRCPYNWIDEEHVPLINATFLFLYSSGGGRLSLNGDAAAILCLETDSEVEGSGRRLRI